MLQISIIVRKIYEANPILIIKVDGENVKSEELDCLQHYFKEETEVKITNAVIKKYGIPHTTPSLGARAANHINSTCHKLDAAPHWKRSKGD